MVTSKFSKYNKFLVGIIGVVVTGLVALYGNDPRVQVLTSVLTALGVYIAPNRSL